MRKKMESDFCEGCKNFDKEDCKGDIEVFECDYKEIIWEFIEKEI